MLGENLRGQVWIENQIPIRLCPTGNRTRAALVKGTGTTAAPTHPPSNSSVIQLLLYDVITSLATSFKIGNKTMLNFRFRCCSTLTSQKWFSAEYFCCFKNSLALSEIVLEKLDRKFLFYVYMREMNFSLDFSYCEVIKQSSLFDKLMHSGIDYISVSIRVFELINATNRRK